MLSLGAIALWKNLSLSGTQQSTFYLQDYFPTKMSK